MTAQEYLEQVKVIDRRIQKKRLMAKKLRESLYGSAINYENIGAANQRSCNDPLGRTVAQIVDYEKEADAEVAQLVKLRIDIERAILGVPDSNQQEALERKYLLNETPEKIAATMGCCVRTVYNYINDGLKHIRVPEDLQ